MYYWITFVIICIIGIRHDCKLRISNFKQLVLLVSARLGIITIVISIAYNGWYYSSHFLDNFDFSDRCSHIIFLLFLAAQVELYIFAMSFAVVYTHIYKVYTSQQDSVAYFTMLYPWLLLGVSCTISVCGYYLRTRSDNSACFSSLPLIPFMSSICMSWPAYGVILFGEGLFVVHSVKLLSSGYLLRGCKVNRFVVVYLLAYMYGIMLGCLQYMCRVDVSTYESLKMSFQWTDIFLVSSTVFVHLAMISTFEPLRRNVLFMN